MDELIPPRLILRPNHQEEILDIARSLAPIEACGIIAGEFDISDKVYPIANALNSPTEFLMDAEQMVAAFYEIEENGWQILAFFHSHPASPPFPSPTDLSRNNYPDKLQVIAGIIEFRWVLKAFQLLEHHYIEFPIVNSPS